MGRVLVTSQLPAGALAPLAGHEIVQTAGQGPNHEALRVAVTDVDGLVCLLTDRIDARVLLAGSRLRVVGNVAVGVDNIDLRAARAAGVAVCNTPGVLDETTADLAVALMLAAARLMGDAERDLRSGRWAGWGLEQYVGHDVHGATLGLVGYGRIGRAVARRAAGFDMRVLHHTRHPTGVAGWTERLTDLLAASDFVSLHVPLTDGTRHLIGSAELGVMKPTAVLVNTARGPVVDEPALAEALERRQLFAAGLDVYEQEPKVHPRLLAAPRTVLLPHIGSATVATRTRMAWVAADGVRAVLAGEHPDNLVELPAP